MAQKVTVIPATKNRFTSAPVAEKKKRRVAGYARVSTDSEEQQTSYDAQVSYYTDYIKSRKDWEFVDVYTDEGISATNTKHRDGFNQMVQDALSGKIDLIVTKSVSRFARNTVDSLSTIRKLKERGVECYFEKENIWTLDSKGELLITIMSSLAQEESRSISENTTWGKRKSFADGKVTLGYRWFLGYDRGPDGKMVINEEQAKTIRLIYGYYLSGLSINAITKKLTELGRETPSGKGKWYIKTVESILTNEKYRGDAILQKYYTADFLSHRRVKNNGELPQYYVPNDHEAIIAPEEFDAVQEEMARRKREKRAGGRTIFSSKIKCGDCGFWYGSKVWHSNDPYRKIIWQCGHKFADKAHKCRTPHLSEEQIKAAFVKAMNKVFAEKEDVLADLQTLMETCTDTSDLEVEREKAAGEMKVWADALDKEIEKNTRVAQDQDEYRKREANIRQKFEAAKNRYDVCGDEIQTAGASGKAVKTMMDKLTARTEPLAVFDELLWCELVDYMTVYRDGRIVVSFKAGMETEVR